MTGVIAVTLAAGWPARAVNPSPDQLALIVGLLTAAAVWIRSGQRGEAVERYGVWALLGVVIVAVQATGDLASPYRSLYVLVALYGAIFFATRRFLPLLGATLLATAAAVVRSGPPYVWAEGAAAAVVGVSAALFLHHLVRRLSNAAQTDGLTGLWNHAAFWRRLQAEYAKAQRQQSPYSVLLIDVDHFKAVNDQYGHQFGDSVLRRLADVLANRVRGSDVLARYGGEEFAVLLPDTGSDRAAQVAEKLRRLLAVAGISVSIGVADNADSDAKPDDVVGAADAALYAAKAAGRARVAIAPPRQVINLPDDGRSLRASG